MTWTGVLDARRTVVGMNVGWEYSPSEFKVLASQDGSNFEEVQHWQGMSRRESKFDHTVMFNYPIAVRAITIAMRSPRSWLYFGLNRVTLLAQPGHVMIVSGTSAASGELCLTARGHDVSLMPCLATIAAGDGKDIFQFSRKGALENIASHECVAVSEGGERDNFHVLMGTCPSADEAAAAAHLWQPQVDGQVKIGRLGSSCLAVASESAHNTRTRQSQTAGNGYGFDYASLIAQNCAVAAQMIDARDKFFIMSMPAYDIGVSTLARDGAALLVAARSKLASLVTELRGTSGVLASCGYKSVFLSEHTRESNYTDSNNNQNIRKTQSYQGSLSRSPISLTTANVNHGSDLYADASARSIAKIGSELNVDEHELFAVIAESRQFIMNIRAAMLSSSPATAL